MKIAVISENDFGFSNSLKRLEHDTRSYKCSSFHSVCDDVCDGYKPDCIFLMDNGRIPPLFWDKSSIESHFGFCPVLVYFTREGSLKIPEGELKKIKSSDLVFTQNNHWLAHLAFKKINIFRFPYWVDTKVFSPDGSVKQYDCISSTEDLGTADKAKTILSSRGLTFFNNPNCDSDFLNSGKIFLNFEKRIVTPRSFFEASACGLPILSAYLHECSEIESLFEEEREILYFSSLDECASRAYLYSRSSGERDRLTIKSFYLIEKYHTIEKRIRTFIKRIKIFRS